ncbi:MAG: FCD domain-containing protein, partial [Acidimicrobiales bacterium]
PAAAATVARSSRRKSASKELVGLIDEQEASVDDPDAFGAANARFHERLVALAGNQTLTIVAEMLNEIVSRAVTAVSQSGPHAQSIETRRRGIRSQRRLVELIAAGDSTGAEEHWRAHMAVVGKVLLGQQATTVIDLLDHY